MSTNMQHVLDSCEDRHIQTNGDWCNKPIVDGSRYCRSHKCSAVGCVNRWGCQWPMLGIALCSEHIKKPPTKYRALVAESMSGPDDFDIPEMY